MDSSDEERLGESVEELNNLMGDDALKSTPLLVFANKQDLQFALEAEEVLKTLKLEEITDR